VPDTSTFAIIAAASLALTLTPGPAVLYIVARGVEGGRPAGLVSALGIATGGLVHILFAAVGLSAILASSATAFSVVKWLGVAYLLWLGLSRLFGRDDLVLSAEERKSLPGVFWQGMVVDVLNPKVALFFLAFLPQFVDPALGSAWLQILLLGLTFSVVGLCTDSLYALLSGTAGGWLRRRYESVKFRRGQRYFSGGVYLALGAATAVSGSGKE
jgi:threonine/homoserine/homoserine lactone efflux protein